MDLALWKVAEETAIIGEQARLAELEAVIERGLKTFVDVGNALLEIRDSRLYRVDYPTFEGYCRERWGWARNYANKLIRAAEVVENLGTLVPILPETETQVRPLTSLPPEEQPIVWQRAVETAPEGKITAAHVRRMVDEAQQKPHVSFNSGNNEWYTPAEYLEAARRVMGDIDLDPASSDIANQTVCAKEYYTAEDDGLKYPWHGRVWMNPPYASELIGRFAEKISLHYATGDISEAIVLVNNATETGWFQTMLANAAAVCFIRRRVKFIDMDGNPSGAPLQGQAILYLGDKPHVFAEKFKEFGAILYG